MRRRVGVSISRDRLTAAGPPAGLATIAGSPWSRSLTASDSGLGWIDLSEALCELRATVGRRPLALDVALLPPMAQIRRIELPRLTEDEMRSVLARDAGRYLLEAFPAVAATILNAPAGRRSPVPYLAAFADTALVESIHDAAESAGWGPTRIIPAHSAWEAVIRGHAPSAGRGPGCVLVANPSRVEALVFEAGRLVIGRRFDASLAPERMLERLGEHFNEGTAPWFAVVGPPESCRPLEEALRGGGLALPELSRAASRFQTAELLAAAGATLVRGGELIPEPIRLERLRRAARLSLRLLAGAAAMLLLSAGLELWGVKRELAAVEDERRAVRGVVAQAIELRQTVEGIQGRLDGLAVAEATASRWSGVIADVADHLPADAHLISLRGAADTLVLEGVANRAAGAFEGLRGAPGVIGVRAEAPIRQESQDSGATVERFSLGARLATNRTVRKEGE
jgi:hypothetical protein